MTGLYHPSISFIFFCDFNNPGLRNATCLTNQMEWQRVFNIVHVEVEVRRSRWVIKCGSGTSQFFFSVEVLQLSHHAISWVPGILQRHWRPWAFPRKAVDQKKLHWARPGSQMDLTALPRCTQSLRSLKWWEPFEPIIPKTGQQWEWFQSHPTYPLDSKMMSRSKHVTPGDWGGLPFRNHTWPKKIPYLQIACSQQIYHWTINIAKENGPKK